MDSLFLFITASLAVIIIPGPDFIYVLSKGISGGRNQGIISAAGISAGLIFHSLAAALGIAVILQSIPGIYLIIKSVGGLYLIYLGAKSILHKDSMSNIQQEDLGTRGKCFLQGFFCNVLNPKIILFFLAFLPQFVDQDSENTSLSLLFRGVIYAVITFVLYSTLGFFSGIIASALTINKKVIVTVHIISALILISLGISLLVFR